MSSSSFDPTQQSAANKPSETLRPVSRSSAVGTPAKFFIPTGASKKYFDYTRLVTILKGLLRPRTESDCQLLANRILTQGRHGCLSVFLILQEIGQAHLIETVLRNPLLHDDRLPFENPPNFPNGISLPDFRARQQPFVAPSFYNGMDVHFFSEQVLPIEEKVSIPGCQSENIYRIKVHPEFDQLQTVVDIQHPNLYVLKTFSGSEGERDYFAEVESYRRTQSMGKPIKSLIRFFGSYKYQDEWNMILEYADLRTLEDFMESQRPPKRATDIMAIWENQLELSKAVQRVHIARGCHQDVVPHNLVMKRDPRDNDYHCAVKLIDFNLSEFSQGEAGQELFVMDKFGAGDYGAPDCFRRDNYAKETELRIPQNVDVWSLGCVWLVVAVWLTEGLNGVQFFREQRLAELEELWGEDRAKIAYFHDGHKPLECVQHRLQSMCDQRSAGGVHSITGRVCEVLIKGMLRGNHTERTNSSKLVEDCEALKNREMGQNSGSNTMPFPQVGNRETLQSIQRISTAPATAHPENQSNREDTTFNNPKPILDRGIASTPTSTPRVQSFETPAFQRNQHGAHTMSHHTLQAALEVEALDRGLGTTREQGREIRKMPYSVDSNLQGDPEHQTDRYYSSEAPRTSPPSRGKGTVYSAVTSGPSFNHERPPGYSPVSSRPREIPYRTRTDSKDTTVSSQSPTRTSLNARNFRSVVPELDLLGAASWMEAKKRGLNPELPHARELKGKLRERDHVFILDDGYSIKPYWPSVLKLLEILSFIVEKDDPDGVELHFTNATSILREKESARLVNFANGIEPAGLTTMDTVLNRIIPEYITKLETQRSVRPLSIYVLTDGKWWGGGENPIILLMPLIESLVKMGYGKEEVRQVGVQFISWGNETQLMDAMDEMQDQLELELDIVDRTAHNGNVWKMLLGAIDDRFDKAPS